MHEVRIHRMGIVVKRVTKVYGTPPAVTRAWAEST
jgi:hypothetical protein